MLAQASAAAPDDGDLIYDQAMVAEKLNRLDDMERLLRRLIELKPDNQNAYNALGYSFADRKVRLRRSAHADPEGRAAGAGRSVHRRQPGLGRIPAGQHGRGLAHPRGRLQERPDPEIGAHLGEVLWATGQRDRAVTIWKEAVAGRCRQRDAAGNAQAPARQAVRRRRGAAALARLAALLVLAGCASAARRAARDRRQRATPGAAACRCASTGDAGADLLRPLRPARHRRRPANSTLTTPDRQHAGRSCTGRPARPCSRTAARRGAIDSVDALIEAATGAAIPVGRAVRLAGRPRRTRCPAGSADLSPVGDGRLQAMRESPQPARRPAHRLRTRMKALYDLPAPAKLNLFLHITGRRDDGYHLLQSVFMLIDWCDTLHVELRDDGRLTPRRPDDAAAGRRPGPARRPRAAGRRAARPGRAHRHRQAACRRRRAWAAARRMRPPACWR